MPCDYQAIRSDNERRYGTEIWRIGQTLLAERYDDRTHFIYELLQNAEDALEKRVGWTGQRSVRFRLAEHELHVSHFGRPFSEKDVRRICGIAEIDDEPKGIGRFGIGFKSVYAFTDRPAIHSGSEDFAIESFVWPVAVPPVSRGDGETVITIPLKPGGTTDRPDITCGLQRLGARVLLFLRQIEDIEWEVEGGASGLYLRSQPEPLGDGVRRVTLLGQATGETDSDENWLVFSRPVTAEGAVPVRYAEIAFLLIQDLSSGGERIQPVGQSHLVVSFPTVLETYLGFLVQGPYRTTPSRDNVPWHDVWNEHCVTETAQLLVDAMRWLRTHGLLDAGVLRCLPLDHSKFGGDSRFAPLFRTVKQAFTVEALLPRFGGGHIAAGAAKLARTQDLRELFDGAQLAMLFGAQGDLAWLSSEITLDRTPDLRDYLMGQLNIEEVRAEVILAKLNSVFLEQQTDAWVGRLYEFLGGQKTLHSRAKELPLVRLVDGKHVRAHVAGSPQAFLPGAVDTGFPTVRPGVCSTEGARAFLRVLGLTEPDAVDDVVRNVLPKYREAKEQPAEEAYAADLRRMLFALGTDSASQREKLVAAARETPFVAAVDQGDGSRKMARPAEVYLATERLSALLSGVKGALLVDSGRACLRGEDARELLEACGAVRYLRPTPVTPSFSWEQLRDMRIAGGCESISSSGELDDTTLDGLGALLAHMQTLGPDDRRTRAQSLWSALFDLAERRGSGVFSGTYRWFFTRRRVVPFDAAFVRLLNAEEWVPDTDGALQRPELILFESLAWAVDPFLLSVIRFRPPIINQLAREAGIEPGVLDLLKRLGLTSEAQLRARLGDAEDPASSTPAEPGDVKDALTHILGVVPESRPAVTGAAETDGVTSGGSGRAVAGNAGAMAGGAGTAAVGTRRGGEGAARQDGSRQGGGKRTFGGAGARPFISYVAAYQHDEEPDPDGLDHPARMALEAKAIEFVRFHEPKWKPMPTLNPGFDLLEADTEGQPARWCELKAMTGSLEDRPVGLTHAQFECAREHGEAYWLYVVEHAGQDNARIVRIQDPAGRARTFTFDYGWLAVADLDHEQEDGGTETHGQDRHHQD